MNRIKVWPHMTIVAVVIALIAGFGVAFWLKHEQTVSAAEMPYAARIQRVDGDVAFSDNTPNTKYTDANRDWIAATPNQPFSVGESTHATTRAPRSRLVDAISHDSIQTPRLM